MQPDIWTWTGLAVVSFLASSATAQTMNCNASFYLNLTSVSYQQASLTCQKQGGELAFPASTADDQTLQTLLLNFGVFPGGWVGVNRRGVPQTTTPSSDWADEFGNRLLSSQVRFAPGNPNEEGECVRFVFFPSPGLDDRPCSERMPFACWGDATRFGEPPPPEEEEMPE